ncbi:MAG: helix-turn-helix transcriptional regulator [Pseudomonadota bacterium]
MGDMGDRLKVARVAAGYNSARAAAMNRGWKVSTYSAHENGQNDFGPEDAIKYAKAFKTSPGYLLTGEPRPTLGVPMTDPVEALKHIRTLIRAASQIDDVEVIHKNLKEAEAIIAKAIPKPRGK